MYAYHALCVATRLQQRGRSFDELQHSQLERRFVLRSNCNRLVFIDGLSHRDNFNVAFSCAL